MACSESLATSPLMTHTAQVLPAFSCTASRARLDGCCSRSLAEKQKERRNGSARSLDLTACNTRAKSPTALKHLTCKLWSVWFIGAICLKSQPADIGFYSDLMSSWVPAAGATVSPSDTFSPSHFLLKCSGVSGRIAPFGKQDPGLPQRPGEICDSLSDSAQRAC